ncbi:MAG: NAD-dependent epimerase/dehydratase family protein [Ottowia sp.]
MKKPPAKTARRFRERILPVNLFFCGARPRALPARFRRARVLIVGCGDVGVRAARLLLPRVRVLALCRSAAKAAALRQMGITPLAGDLDAPASLRRLAAWAGRAGRVLHLAPPAPSSNDGGDARTLALARALRRRWPAAFVYGSTSGVYGDAQGGFTPETRPLRPQTARARRRAAAEAVLRPLGAAVLRIPGIYAADRPGGSPRARLERRAPVLAAPDDVYTSHIHAEDLARACALALWRARPRRAYNVCDDSQMKMGDWFELAARLCGLPCPPRMPRAEAEAALPALQMSFLRESRRLTNQRLKRELRLKLRYPTAESGLKAALLLD